MVHFDLKNSWQHHKSKIISPFLIGALACAGYLYLTPKQWESSVIIQIGQVGQQAIGLQSQLIETGPRVFERVKSRSFKDDLLKKFELLPKDNQKYGPEAQIINNSLSVKLLTSPDLVELKVRGLSPEKSNLLMHGVVDQLKMVHEALASPTLKRFETSLKLVQSELGRLEVLRNEYKARLLSDNKTGKVESFLQASLFSQLLDTLDRDQRALLERRHMIEEQMASARTYSTSALGEFVTSREPAAPSKWLAIFGTLILACVFSALILLSFAYRDFSTNAKKDSEI